MDEQAVVDFETQEPINESSITEAADDIFNNFDTVESDENR